MFRLKIFVRVQTFRRVPPVLPCNFCHPGNDNVGWGNPVLRGGVILVKTHFFYINFYQDQEPTLCNMNFQNLIVVKRSNVHYAYASDPKMHVVKIYLLTSTGTIKYFNLILQLIDFGAVHMIFCSVVKYIYQEPIQIRPLRTWIFLKTAPPPFWEINLIHTYLDTILGYKLETQTSSTS